mgnify:CR=1 FL=1
MVIGGGDVAAADFGEIVEEVAFGLFFTDPDGFGADAEGAELVGERLFGEMFAVAEGCPGAVGEGVQGGDEVAAEEAGGGGLGEAKEEGEEEGTEGAAVQASKTQKNRVLLAHVHIMLMST